MGGGQTVRSMALGVALDFLSGRKRRLPNGNPPRWSTGEHPLCLFARAFAFLVVQIAVSCADERLCVADGRRF